MSEKCVTEKINKVFKFRGGFRKIHFRLENNKEVIFDKFKFNFEFQEQEIIVNDFIKIDIKNIAAIY